MIESIDQLGNHILLKKAPRRIISVVPSQSELLFDLGLKDEVVGITNFCIHPRDRFLSTPRVGGTKKLNLDKIATLEPDLIIANKEENSKEEIEQLQTLYPVWISDIYSLDDALDMIKSIGELIQRSEESDDMIGKIKLGFSSLPSLIPPISVAYFIWRKPWMVAGANTYINHLLNLLGFTNVINTENNRYPEVDLNSLKKLKPKYILLSSEPYPFKDRHIEEIQAILPESKIMLVDGEMFSWYGSRLLLAPNYFKSLLSQMTE